MMTDFMETNPFPSRRRIRNNDLAGGITVESAKSPFSRSKVIRIPRWHGTIQQYGIEVRQHPFKFSDCVRKDCPDDAFVTGTCEMSCMLSDGYHFRGWTFVDNSIDKPRIDTDTNSRYGIQS
jgi:hypothetical protein